MEIPDTPFCFSHQSLPVRRGQPRLGANTETVLREAGLSEDQINNILAKSEEAQS